MTRETRFGRLRAAFDQVQDLAAPERDEAIRTLSGNDPGFETELRALLAAAERSTTPLDRPPLREPGASPESPEPIPGYEILQPIGRGGSATVYLAEQLGEGFTRQVALKVLGRWVDTSRLRRFRAEQSILAALEHPGIARLYDAGITPSGQPYLAIELVRGVTLIEHCERIGATTRERIELFLEILEAVEHAHASSVVHRDLKPGNILVSERGEPKLLDFGIARLLAEGAPVDATETQHRAMTPAYASPEQLRGEPVERASDLYSLGVVLYELLAGRRPYKLDHAGPEALDRAIREQEPEPTGLGGDLDAILAQALRKEPGGRYASAADFAVDLKRYLEGRTVLARRGSLLYSLGKGLRRRRGLWLNVTLAGVLLAVGALWISGALRDRRPVSVDSADSDRSPWLAMPVAATAQASYARGLDEAARYETAAALRSLRAAVSTDPDHPLIHAALADALALADRDQEAHREGQKALTESADLPRESQLLVASIALRTSGQRAKEAELLRSLWLLRPDRAEVGLRFAESLAAGGRPAEALEIVAKLGPVVSSVPQRLRLGQIELEAQFQLGRASDVRERAAKLADDASAQGFPVLSAKALLSLGGAQDALGANEEARAAALRAERLFRARGEIGGVARALQLRCTSLIRDSKNDEAERACEESLRLRRQLGNPAGIMRVLNNLGILKRHRGLVIEARATIAEALGVATRNAVGDPAEEARFRFNLANLDVDLGHLGEAETNARKALDLYREAGNVLGTNRVRAVLATILQQRGELTEAESLLVEIEAVDRQAGAPRDLATLFWLRAEWAAVLGDEAQALAWFDRAAALFPQAGRASDLPVLLASRRQVPRPSDAVCRGQENALRPLEESHHPAAELNRILIARCWSEAGSAGPAARWVELSRAAATSQRLETRVQWRLAAAAVALGDRRWTEAERLLAAAEAECRTNSQATLLMETRLLQTRLARARGDHPERVRTLAEELERDAKAGRFGKIARQAGEILRAPRG
ncbi:MAG TPA: serine/threonine-protein kinase [Thermoanaerobaculia bacterium]|nr:serine/threonine-protein kinase [Thermoanaerobaculia bacterium]